MNSSLPLPLLLFSLFIVIGFPLSLSSPEIYKNCHDEMFKCGNMSVGYPFSGGKRLPECGHRGVGLHCDPQNTTTIEIGDAEYQVLGIDQDHHILRIAREGLIRNDFCRHPNKHQDSILDSELFSLAPGYTNVLVYVCETWLSPIAGLGVFNCNEQYKVYVTIGDNITTGDCFANVTVPILSTLLQGLRNHSLPLEEALKTEFKVKWKEDRETCWKCNASGGACGFDMRNQETCYCPFGFEKWEEAEECHREVSNPEFYRNCHDEMFKCGNISVGYPFYGGKRQPECGHRGVELHCDPQNITTIEIGDAEYQILGIDQDHQILRIAGEGLIKNDFCGHPNQIQNSILDFGLFSLAPGYTDILFHVCEIWLSPTTGLGVFSCNEHYKVYVTLGDSITPKGCFANVTVPILRTLQQGLRNHSLPLEEALKTEFKVQWKEDREACRKCNASGGACGFDMRNQETCYCPFGFDNRVEAEECHRKGPNSKLNLNLIIGLTIGVTLTIVLASTICFTVRRFKRKSKLNLPFKGKMNDNAKIEAFITKFGSLAPRQYSYGDIKKMTNKFKDKLGQGGFGSVYKGKLPDGCLVAVKVLSESKGNGENFMNEVASISRTSHVNIVTLLGFCFERSKRALVYEFMPCGSLDRFIYNQGSHHQSRQLEWKTVYDIALGIAKGLEYLHQGCKTKILHFDIKPHNILLDENFCPKISDFGLSKLCERKDSIISMACARGTIGYIAPEVTCRSFGGVSHKSDVYSYGMLVLEMVGGRKNIDVGVSKTSEVYFPSWIYKQLDQSMNLNLNGVIAEEEQEITRKLIIVSLWCIQHDPSDRPSITKVLEMLQGSLHSLIIPPKPFVSSPVQSPKVSS